MLQIAAKERVAILGGGIMGCLAALELADRGVEVTLYEANSGLLQKASRGGEAKLHHGYVYANEPDAHTARKLATAYTNFQPIVERLLGDRSKGAFVKSRPFTYALHADSMLDEASIDHHLRATHQFVLQAQGDALGCRPPAQPRRLNADDLVRHFDPTQITAAWSTDEYAIDSLSLSKAILERIAENPLISVRLKQNVEAVSRTGCSLHVVAGFHSNSFDQIINCAWAGRLEIDASMGVSPPRKWMFRHKYGVRLPSGSAPEDSCSATFTLGPFGDVVRYADGSMYLSWYPACMTGISFDERAPEQPSELKGDAASQMVEETINALGELMPPLAKISSQAREAAIVRGGAIFALGDTDIDDAESELHQRHDVGISSYGNYHTVDTGKYTMAPLLAVKCADRVLALAE
ncbi:MAG: FAD-dependent oxidoreductase [Pseudomonadota bacterium]